MFAAAVLALSIVTPGCVGHLPPCPAAGGPAWTELQGSHFRLRTDLDPPAARALLTDLEQFQAALLAVFGAPPDLDFGRIPAIAVDRGWTDFASRDVAGYFTRALFQPLVVIRTGTRLSDQILVRHELVHYLSRKIIRKQPAWLSEGLATYYETIEYAPDTGRITVGRPSSERLSSAQTLGLSNIEKIFTASEIDPDDAPGFYAAAWITTHYLMNHRLEAMFAYQKALRTGATPEAAWTAAFGAETHAQLAAEVHRYLDGGQYALLIYRLPAPNLPAPVERRLTDADAHATRALLYLTGSGTRAVSPELAIKTDDPQLAAQREVAEARRAQPAHLMADAIAHFMLKTPVDLAQATLACKASPDDWLAWLLLSEALEQSPDRGARQQALKRAADLAGDDLSVELHAERDEN